MNHMLIMKFGILIQKNRKIYLNHQKVKNHLIIKIYLELIICKNMQIICLNLEKKEFYMKII